MLFDIYQTTFDDQVGTRLLQKEYANQEEADAFCEELDECNEGYLHIARPGKPENIKITPELERLADRVRLS